MDLSVSISKSLSEDELLAVEVLSTLLPASWVPFSRKIHKADNGLEKKPWGPQGCQWHRWKAPLSHLAPSATELTRHWDTKAEVLPDPKWIQEVMVSTSVSTDAALEPGLEDLAAHSETVQSHIKVSREIEALFQVHPPTPDIALGRAEFTSPASTTLNGLETPSGASPFPPSTCDSTRSTPSGSSCQNKRRRLNKECFGTDSRSITSFTLRRSTRKPPGPPPKTPERIEMVLSRRQVPNGSMTPEVDGPLVFDRGIKKKDLKRKRPS